MEGISAGIFKELMTQSGILSAILFFFVCILAWVIFYLIKRGVEVYREDMREAWATIRLVTKENERLVRDTLKITRED